MRIKEESDKAGLKLSVQKMKIKTTSPITSWQIDGDKVKAMTDFIFLGSKITVMVTAATKLKDACSLEAITNLDSVLKSKDMTLPTRVYIVQAMVFSYSRVQR